jgi:TetR/AcrR family acrAB operon transcriptional repressor
MARRTKQEALETRDGILDAAEHLFHARGVSHTSLNDIAQAAGVTRGAIYWHFCDKSAVFNAMMDRVCLPLEASADLIEQAPQSNPVMAIRDPLIDIFHRLVGDAQLRRVFEIATHKVEYSDELLAVRERHIEVRDAYLQRTERLMRGALRTGQLPEGRSARVAAVGLHALVDGLIQNWVLDPQAFDLVLIGTESVDAYLHGLCALRDDVPCTKDDGPKALHLRAAGAAE